MSSSLRVAWLGQRSASDGDGLITYSREITMGLRDRGVKVSFFHHEVGEVGEVSEADDDSIALPAFKISRQVRIASPGTSRQLESALRRQAVDVVHVSLSFSSLDFALPELCHQLNLPIVATFHAPFDTHPTPWGMLSHALYRFYAPLLSSFDAVIVFGARQRRFLTDLGVPERVLRVIPNGVDVDRYSPGPSGQREKLNAERMFIYQGRLDSEKNVGVLLEAFVAAKPPPGLLLAVVGAGSERKRLERRFGGTPVVFLGLVKDEEERIELLRGSEAFFLPSAIEGLSLALLEAMGCGVCPVATDVGCDGDAVRGAGILLDPVPLSSDLKLAMRLLVDTPVVSQQLGKLARQRAVERYSLDRNIDALLALYEELLSKSPGTASTAPLASSEGGILPRGGRLGKPESPAPPSPQSEGGRAPAEAG